jgi:hypothetical protein
MGTRYIPLSEVAPGLPLSPKKKPVPQDEDALVRQHRGVTFDDEPATAAPAAAQPSEGVTFAEPTQQQQPAAAPQQSYPEIIGHFGSDVLQGLGAGVLSTIFHGGDLLRRATGQPRIIDTPDVRSAITPPESLAGKLGYGGEKMAEFFIPAGAVGRAGQAVEAATAGMRGAGALNLAARAALEGTAAGGVAGVQTGGNVEAMKDAALMGAGTTAALGAAAAAAPAYAGRLTRKAEELYGKVLNPAQRPLKAISRTQTIPGLLERRVTGRNLQGMLDRTQDEVAHWGQAVQDAWATIPQDTPLQVAPMLQALDAYVAPAVIRGTNLGPAADTMVNHANHWRQVLTDLAHPNPQTGALEITVGDLRGTREFADLIAAQGGSFLGGKPIAEQSLTRIHEVVGNAARAQINPRYPHVEQANEQYNFWRNAERVVDETMQRKVGQEGGLIKTIGNTIGATTGGAIGSQIGGTAGTIAGTVIGTKIADMLQTAMKSPAWRTTNAVTKQRLAEALTNGNIGGVEFYLRKILGAAGGAKATMQPSLQYSAGAPNPQQLQGTDEEIIQKLLTREGDKKMIPVTR